MPTSAEDALARALRLRKDGLASDADVEQRARDLSGGAQTLAPLANADCNAGSARPSPAPSKDLTAKPGDLIAAGTTVATIGTRAICACTWRRSLDRGAGSTASADLHLARSTAN